RHEALYEAGHGSVFRQRDIWRRPADYGNEYDAVAGISGEDATFGSGAQGHRAGVHREGGLPVGIEPRAEDRQAGEDQLRGVLDEILQADSRGAAVFPDVFTRFVLRGD